MGICVSIGTIFPLLTAFSASSNLAYTLGNGTPYSHFVKHIFIWILGFGLMYFFHNIPSDILRKLAGILLILSLFIIESSGCSKHYYWRGHC